jgi:hypothetical protein
MIYVTRSGTARKYSCGSNWSLESLHYQKHFIWKIARPSTTNAETKAPKWLRRSEIHRKVTVRAQPLAGNTIEDKLVLTQTTAVAVLASVAGLVVHYWLQ